MSEHEELLEQQENKEVKARKIQSNPNQQPFSFEGYRRALGMIDLQVDVSGAKLLFYLTDLYKRLGDSISIQDVQSVMDLVRHEDGKKTDPNPKEKAS